MNHQKLKILITGGSGFAGSHLAEALSSDDKNEIHITHFGSPQEFLKKIINEECFHSVDLTNQQATFDLIKNGQFEQIYHLAAFSKVAGDSEAYKKTLDNNTTLSYNLLEAVKQFSPQTKLLIVGSGLVYKRTDQAIDENQTLGPENPYAVSKIIQEMLAYSYYRAYQLPIIIARPFNHIGERQSLGFAIPDFCEQIIKIEKGESNEIFVGNLEAKRDFTDVKDVVKAYILLMNKGQIGEIYNVGHNQAYSIKEMLEKLLNFSSKKIVIKIDANKYRPIDNPLILANINKIKALGWQPSIPIETTLKRIFNWWKENL